MDARDAHGRLSVPVDAQVPPHAQGEVVLGDLIVLRHVGIEVVLAVEECSLGDVAAQREADPDGRSHRGFVGDRQ
jgi:hypothetical protein